MAICEMHKELTETVKDHEKRIVVLEKSDAEFAIRIDIL
jgi:ABC-type Fe3+-citrate transport system substrate-binding protein